MNKYDAIIIGSGQAGNPLSRRLAKAGWNVAIIEKKWAGGTCINDGCTPTKTMIASARIAFLAAKSKEYGVDIPSYSINFRKVMKRKDAIVNSYRNGTEKGLKEKNIDLIYGEATFVDAKTISIKLKKGGFREITADKIFIDTGTRTSVPKIDGLETVPYLTSTSILELKKIPKHLVIIGGSYIGLEFGQMFHRFGTKITIIDSSSHFLPKEDKDIADALRNILEEDGLTIYTAADVKKIKKSENQVEITISVKGKNKKINASHLLVAAGRISNADTVLAENAGLKLDDRGYIKVNNKLETNVKGIYALGESNGGPAYTHIAYNDYVIVSGNLIDKENLSTDGRQVPYCMFTDPQLARIGLTEKQATDLGFDIKVVQLSMDHVSRALETGNTRGLMKAIVDAKTKQILGAAIIGAEGGEIMSVLQTAMLGKLTYEQIRYQIFAHPIYSESLNNLFMALDSYR